MRKRNTNYPRIGYAIFDAQVYLDHCLQAIRRFLIYYTKRMSKITLKKARSRRDPFDVLLLKLLGEDTKPPKRRSVIQQFQHEAKLGLHPRVERKYRQLIENERSESQKNGESFDLQRYGAKLRADAAAAVYKTLSDGEKNLLEDGARREGLAERERWEALMNAPPSRDPAVMQKYVDHLFIHWF
jgi:hypothetical protein